MIARRSGPPPNARRLYALAFGSLLKELRAQHKITPAQAANRVGISLRRWRRYEKGLQVPYLSHLLQFGEPFDVDPVSLLNRIIQHRDEVSLRQKP